LPSDEMPPDSITRGGASDLLNSRREGLGHD